MIVLKADNLQKTYLRELPLYKQIILPFSKKQRIKALDSVSFDIDTGQILGVIGPNGAGKTTLLRILADILQPDSGTVSICGQMSGKYNYKMRRYIGYVSSNERSFFWRLTGRENLEFFARLYGLSASQAKKRTSTCIKQFSFENRADLLFRDYSSGMRKKVSLIRALLHEPLLLLLDEVTNSLDPSSADMIKEMVRKYVSEKKDRAAIWSTHRLEEVSQVCDRVMTIDSGRIAYYGFTKESAENSEFMLKVGNLNGQIEEFCKKTGCRLTLSTPSANTNEFIINGISQKQFSQIVSMAVKDFGLYIIFAGCIKKNPDQI